MKLLRIVLVFCGLLVHAYALDREAFTFTNYNLEVRIEPEQQRLGGAGQNCFAKRFILAAEKSLPSDFLHAGLALDPVRRQTRAVRIPAIYL